MYVVDISFVHFFLFCFLVVCFLYYNYFLFVSTLSASSGQLIGGDLVAHGEDNGFPVGSTNIIIF